MLNVKKCRKNITSKERKTRGHKVESNTNHFKGPLFWDFLGLVPAISDGILAAVGPPNGGGGLVLGDGSDNPIPDRLGSPGTMRCQPGASSPSDRETSLLEQYLVYRAGGGSSSHLRRHLKSWTEASAWTAASSLYRNQSRDDE
jgi:hypothetical protein